MPNERNFTHLKGLQKTQQASPESESNMSSDLKKQWEEKLVGKKIIDDSSSPGSISTFTKRDLPDKHRVVSPGAMMTRDFHPDRLNVYVGEDGVCSHVTMG
ncbi:hypothetical protein Q9L58_001044 [Maublancomyces gigas]|uniref:Uncharacterized protein n=1 Tax=Discina gigas TaxID=1032678 RepID=A0ABR3GVL7_9PEZI